MLPWSIICWLLFEFYNLHLHNWHYTGTPSTFAAQSLLGYWSYATVFPGVLETADLLGAFGPFANRRMRPGSRAARRSTPGWLPVQSA